jgi:hypothetical protein
MSSSSGLQREKRKEEKKKAKWAGPKEKREGNKCYSNAF